MRGFRDTATPVRKDDCTISSFAIKCRLCLMLDDDPFQNSFRNEGDDSNSSSFSMMITDNLILKKRYK